MILRSCSGKGLGMMAAQSRIPVSIPLVAALLTTFSSACDAFGPPEGYELPVQIVEVQDTKTAITFEDAVTSGSTGWVKIRSVAEDQQAGIDQSQLSDEQRVGGETYAQDADCYAPVVTDESANVGFYGACPHCAFHNFGYYETCWRRFPESYRRCSRTLFDSSQGSLASEQTCQSHGFQIELIERGYSAQRLIRPIRTGLRKLFRADYSRLR